MGWRIREMHPLDDYLVVERFDPDTKVGTLWLPEISRDDKVHVARVLKVGPGRYADNGQKVPMVVREGDVVLIGKYIGQTIHPDGMRSDGRHWLAIREDDVIAIADVVSDEAEQESGSVLEMVGG